MSTHENDSALEQAYWEGRYDADKEIATLRKERAIFVDLLERAKAFIEDENDYEDPTLLLLSEIKDVLAKVSGSGK